MPGSGEPFLGCWRGIVACMKRSRGIVVVAGVHGIVAKVYGVVAEVILDIIP